MASGTVVREAEQKILGGLADFLAGREGSICSDWLKIVHDEARLRASEGLEDPLLVDHLPLLLEEICDLCRFGFPEGLEPKHSGHLHGQHRWEQGYDLEQLVLELALLRSVLLRHIFVFSDETPGFTGQFKVEALVHFHRFFDASMWYSTERFVEEQQAQLRDANAARVRLISTFSHELRNIINTMGLAAQSVEAIGEEALTHLPELLGRNVQQMREILDDLLELSALSCGRETVKTGTISLHRLLHDIEVAYRPLGAVKGLKFSSELDPELGEVIGDELKTRQIVSNLVSNAVKYTESGEIRVSFRAVGADRWAAVVTDTGVGISDDHQDRIFSEFYRVDETSRVEGMGLGLAISTRLVQLLGGEMKLTSEQGKGSTFEVLLPRVYRSEAATHPVRTDGATPRAAKGKPESTYTRATGTG